MLTGHLCIFGQISVQIFCLLLDELVIFLLLNYKVFLYILDINPLSDTLFANVFSHSVGCLLTFLDEQLIFYCQNRTS